MVCECCYSPGEKLIGEIFQVSQFVSDDLPLAAQATPLRDLFGPLPFRPVALNPACLSWHGGLLVSMAQKRSASGGGRRSPRWWAE
jgi:hypothetical protein